jgi:TldD protein
MLITRRSLLHSGLKVGATAAALASLPRPLLAQLGSTLEPLPPIDDPRLKELTARALEAARSAGAEYADERLTHERVRSLATGSDIEDSESMLVGVRALVNGYWGFASSPVWSPDEMARLARESVNQAKTNALGKKRTVDLVPAPEIADGHWEMPVAIDPYAISPFAITDFLQAMLLHGERTRGVQVLRSACGAVDQEKAFASTAGSYCTQRTLRTNGDYQFVLTLEHGQRGGANLECLTPAGLGWELFVAEKIPRVRDHTIYEEIDRAIEELREDLLMPVKPVEVGRYEAAFDPLTVASIVDETIGRATELDRALGYEANAGGTSYLNDPLGMLGSYQAGAPSFSVNADRSEAGAVATVKWDDEGVEPEAFPLVKDGVLTDFQTTRESARWLEAAYTKHGRPVKSHGCAGSESAVFAPLQHSPNLSLAAGREAKDFDAIVAGMTKGIAVKSGSALLDFQHSSGLGLGRLYDVKQGKRVARLSGGFLFRATELWKSLQALGGDASLRRYGMVATKGEPEQQFYHSVTTPAALVKDLTIIDPLRKA